MELPKETGRSKQGREHGRWYHDACGTAFALEVLGERWTLLILRELLLGPRRFSDLRAGLPAISAKVLSERLEALQDWGVVQRRQLPPPAGVQVYELTEWGRMAEAPIMELGRWAARSVRHNPRLPLSTASLITSMKTMQLPDRIATAPSMAIGIRVAGEGFVARIAAGKLEISRADPLPATDVVLEAEAPMPIAAALYRDVPLEQLEAEMGLVVQGDRAAARQFLSLFALPPKLDGCAV